MAQIVEKLRKKIIAAIDDFGMIQNWDKVILATSWGKDSLTLLQLLNRLQRDYRVWDFELKAVYVVPQIPWYKHHWQELETFFQQQKIDYNILHMQVPEGSKLHQWFAKKRACQRCTYARRISLFKYAEKQWFNKIAYWHHMDDMIDTLFMNIYTWTNLKIMPAVNKLKSEDLTIIRPLAYIREAEIVKYLSHKRFKVFPCGCPVLKYANRLTFRRAIDKLEEQFPWFVERMFWAYQKRLPDDLIVDLSQWNNQ